MELTTNLLPFATAFGIALLHSLWMGLLLYALVRTIAPLIPAAAARYYLAYGSLLLLAAGFTYVIYDGFHLAPSSERLLSAAPPQAFSPGELLTTVVSEPNRWLETINRISPWLSILYLFGFIPACYFLWRNQQLIKLLKQTDLSDLPGDWVRDLEQCLANNSITQRASMHLSGLATEVMTIGFWSPVIVVPVALAARLTPAMARTLLLHEIAHLRHYDHLLNYPQQALRVVFFYHPAVHALCRFIDREREHRCDDWVARRCPDERRVYAAALIAAAQISLTQNPLAMSATKTNFTSRVHRLFNGEETPDTGAVVLSLVFIFALGATQFSLTDPGAAAGAVNGLEAQTTVEPAFNPTTVTPSVGLSETLETTHPNQRPRQPQLASPLARRALQPAAAPLLKSDTIAPLDVKIKNDARVIEGDYRIMIDGKLTKLKSLNDVAIPEGQIKRIKVLKEKSDLFMYGLSDLDALVVIQTKLSYHQPQTSGDPEQTHSAPAAAPERSATDTISMKEFELDNENRSSLQMPAVGGSLETSEAPGKPGSHLDQNIAYFINGKRIELPADPFINPEDIMVISVVKDSVELRAAGLDGYEGAIYISSRKYPADTGDRK